MKKQTILIIGYGNMASAIIKGMIESHLTQSYNLEITGRNEAKIQHFLQAHSLKSHFKILPSAPHIDIEDKIVLLCTKPYGFKSFAYNGVARALLSILAGVEIKALKACIKSQGYARIMPNTAASYQKSSSAVYAENLHQDLLEPIVRSFGNYVAVDLESHIDASLATSASSPAFIALIAQALIDSGVREGLSRKQSRELVTGMFDGFAELLKNQDPQNIIDSITSPGGTTIEGLSVLEEEGVRGAIIKAAHAAVLKARSKP